MIMLITRFHIIEMGCEKVQLLSSYVIVHSAFLCPINHLGLCDGPADTYISHCGRYRSTLDYIFVPTVCSMKYTLLKRLINALLIALSNHSYALKISSLSLPSPSFAEDISLLAIQLSVLRFLMQMCYC